MQYGSKQMTRRETGKPSGRKKKKMLMLGNSTATTNYFGPGD